MEIKLIKLTYASQIISIHIQIYESAEFLPDANIREIVTRGVI